MAGHSKWAQIKRKKAVTDQKRSKEFSRLGRLLAAESKLVKGDTTAPSLRAVIEKARAAHMSKETIDRAIAKGSGSGGIVYVSNTYEMFGPGGVAILIETMTDSPNRTVQELRHLVSKEGYTLSSEGAALWAFQKNGLSFVPASTVDIDLADAEKLVTLLSAIEAHDDVENIITNAVGFLPGDDADI